MKNPSAAQQWPEAIKTLMGVEASFFAAFEKDGDVRWLEEVERAIVERCRILGIELPSERVAELSL